MQAASLADVFSRHAGFPRAGGARLGSEDFADRLTDRIHQLGDTGVGDVDAWVEHFFDLEHPFEKRDKEFKAAAALADRGPSVLEFELGDKEYVVVEDDHENLVVISSQGTVVLDRRADLAPRVRAAALPEAQQARPGSIFRPQGEHAYFVDRSGKVTSVDSKVVANLLRGVDTRVEPLARVAEATSRLAAFAPSKREAPVELRPAPVRHVAALAKAEKAGTGASVVVVEKHRIREVEGGSAKAWRSLAEKLAARGGTTSSLAARRAGEPSGVALGSRTYAVKVGGVTAVVQRVAPASLAARVEEAGRKLAASPRLAQLVAARTPAEPRGFWSNPVAAQAAAARGGAAPFAMTAAGAVAAGIAVAGGPRASLGRAAPAGFAPEAVLGAVRQARADVRSLMTSGSATAPALVVAAPGETVPRGFSMPGVAPVQEVGRYTVRGGESVFSGPIEARDAMPAGTLFALYGSLERTAAQAGYRLPSLEVSVAAETSPTAPIATYRDTDVSSIREIRLEALPVTGGEPLRAVFQLPFARGGLQVGGDLTQALDALVEQRLAEPSRVSPRFDAVPVVELGTRAASARRAVTASSVPVRSAFASASASAVSDPAIVATESASVESEARPAVSPWVAWAFSNLSEARARTSGSTPSAAHVSSSSASSPASFASSAAAGAAPGFASALGTFGARAGAAGVGAAGTGATVGGADVTEFVAGQPVSSPTGEAISLPGRAPVADDGVRRRSVFLRFDPLDAPARPLNVAEAVAGFPVADTGLVRMPVALDDATFDRMVISSPTITSSAPVGTFAGEWLPAQGIAPSVSMRVKPVLLSDVNAQRLPPSPAGVGGYDNVNSAADEFVVPVPLWVQMGETAASRPAAASPYGPDTTSYFPGAAPSFAGAGVAAGPGAFGPSGSFETRSFPSGGTLSLDAPATSFPGGSLARPDGAGFAVTGGPRRGTDVLKAPGATSSLAGLDLELPDFAGRAASPRVSALSNLDFDLETVTSPGVAARTSSIARAAAAPNVAVSSTGVVTRTVSEPGASSVSALGPIQASSLDGLDLPLSMPAASRPRATRMRRQAGTGYLRFRWPSLARWWSSADAAPARTAGSRFGDAADRSPASPEVVTRSVGDASAPSTARSASGLPGAASGASSIASAAGGAAGALGPVSRAAGVGPVVPRSDGGPSGVGMQFAGTAAGPAAASGVRTVTAGAGSPTAAEQTYVTVAGNGETRVSTPATRAAGKASSSPAAVDMTVVAAVQPQAPSLESMATRAFLKSKKEGPSKAPAGRTDAAGLQGTIDSLAQRIYHRLQRRLKSDEERFGRY